MNKITVLIEGYAKETEDGWLASSTVTLVESNNKKIIIDPGCNRTRLIEELNKISLNPKDIEFVLLTHSHTDHSLLAGIFENARVLTTEEIYDNDNQIAHNNKIPGTNLEIIQTPGHSRENCSLVVPTTEGIFVISGDTFWWMDNEDQDITISKQDEAHPDEVDMERLIESRKKILEIADFVIPGHGKKFKVVK